MFVKIVGQLVWLSSTVFLSYMFYTGDYTYLNIATAYFSVLLTLATLLAPLVLIVLFGAPESDDAKNLFKSLGKSVTGWRQLFIWTKTIITTVLLSLTGYAFMLAWYVVMSVCLGKVMYMCKDKSKT